MADEGIFSSFHSAIPDGNLDKDRAPGGPGGWRCGFREAGDRYGRRLPPPAGGLSDVRLMLVYGMIRTVLRRDCAKDRTDRPSAGVPDGRPDICR